MANLSPDFLTPVGHTPQNYDSKEILLQKVLGALIDIFAPMNTSPTFFPEKHTPQNYDSQERILQKILGTLIDIDTAGVGGLAGTGSPEGVVTASPGKFYVDTTDPDNLIVWIKATGTGNTGWKQFSA